MTQGAPQPPPAAEADFSGRSLGEYRLIRRLGRGAMAEVYLADQPALRRQVAIKLLRSHLAADASYVARFRIEAQAAASLVHGNIVQIHDVGCIDGLYFIALEYVQGQNLGQLIAKQGRLDPARAVMIVRQAALALHKAGAAGIVHRDIKPENILLTPAGEVKVADFGLALWGGSVGLTQAGVTMGTPLYMSPEQVEGKPLDPRSDIYSLGCTCFHMLAGRPPFQADTPLGVAMQHLKKPPERLENLVPDLPPALARIVHRMLAKAPEDRFQSARELLAELRQLPLAGAGDLVEVDLDAQESAQMQALSAGLSAATQQLAAVMQRDRPGGWWRWKWWLAAAAVLAATALGAGLQIATRDPFLLGASEQATPRQPTLARQWMYAESVNTAEAWRAIERYFPGDRNRIQHLRAQQRLGRLYLTEALRHELSPEELARCEAPFATLAELREPADREFRAYGLSGQFVLLCLQDRPQEANRLLATELMPLLEQLPEDQSLDADMRQIVRYAQQQNARKLNEQQSAELSRQLEQRFGGG